MEDSQIVGLYWSRDEAAIAQTDAKYGRLLRGIALNILSNRQDSEECLLDAYARAWNTMPPQRPYSLMAYLGRIVRNLSINRWYRDRAQKRCGGAAALLSELGECVPSLETVESSVQTRELSRAISDWLYALPRGDRVLFLRRYWFGDALQALARECAMPPGKLAGRMHRLRQSLKKALESEGISI